jgi:hypothetical protein
VGAADPWGQIKRMNRIHQEYICGHVYRLLSEAGVFNTLEPCMFDIREKNVVCDDHQHFTNYL